MNVITAVFVLVVAVAGIAYMRTRFKTNRLGCLTWDELISELQPLPTDAINRIASDYLDPLKSHQWPDRGEVWAGIGGIEGLEKMYANAGVLIALAAHAQRWNEEESVVVSERMRRDSLILRRAILEATLSEGLGRAEGAFSTQQAVSSYWLIVSRLLALYKNSHVARFSRLAELLGTRVMDLRNASDDLQFSDS